MKRWVVLPLLFLAACDGVFRYPDQIASGRPDAAQLDAPVDGKVVFTTSKRYRGGLLGGVTGADAICASHATKAGLSGEFKAWISQLDSSAADRLTHSTKPYVLVGGTMVAESWEALLQFDLLHPIDRDEHGAGLVPEVETGGRVWTSTKIDGRAHPWTPGGTPTSNPRLDCTLWSSIENGVGLTGWWSATDVSWTQTSSGSICSETAHLYCFEQ